MKTEKYITPEIEVIELELEGTMAMSPDPENNSFGLGDGGSISGGSNARRRGLFED